MRKLAVTAYDETIIDGVVDALKQVGIKYELSGFKSEVSFLRDSFTVSVKLNKIEETHIRDTIAAALSHVAPAADLFQVNEVELSR